VEIVQKENYSARKISVNTIGDDLTTDFEDLDVAQLGEIKRVNTTYEQSVD